MPRLRFFGGFRLESQEALTGRAGQRKRLALLALLGTAPDQTLSRDKLISLLWSESSTDRGRHLLASAIYDLRQALGEEALRSVGDDVVLNPALVDSDVAAFEAALRCGCRESAVALYAGPVLDGFFVTGAPEFERWVEEERSRRARKYLDALEALAREREAAGDHRAAADWWRRRAAAEPLSSSATLSLMRALEAAGDRAGAVRQAEANAELLRAEFGAAPDPAVLALAERMRMQPVTAGAHSDSPHAARHPVPDDSAVGPPTVGQVFSTRPEAAASAATLGRPPRRLRVHIAAAVALAVLGAGAVLAARAASASRDSLIRRIAVLPLADVSTAGDADYVADGMTELIIAELARAEELDVISRLSAMRYRATDKSASQAGRELGVDAVVQGSVLQEGGRITVRARLVEVRTGRDLWTVTREEDLGDAWLLPVGLARAIADRLGARLARAESATNPHRVSPEAYDLYLRGRHAWNRRTKEGLEQAVILFRRAIDRDPAYAAAHAGLAEAYVLLGYLGLGPGEAMFPKAKAAALRALEIDGTSASAYAALGQELSWERDWRAAEDAYRTAILLNPGYATALQWYGGMLSKLGRVDEALVLLRRASELDPLSLQINNNYGMVLCYSGDHKGALAHYRRIVEAEPDSTWVRENPWLLSNMARVLSANGLFEEGLELLATALQIVPGHPRPVGDVADIYLKLGRPEDAEAAFARADTSNGHYAGYRGTLYASRGQADSAFAWYDRVRDWGQPLLGDLSMDPRLDPIRDDPRFAALLRELGIGGSAGTARRPLALEGRRR